MTTEQRYKRLKKTRIGLNIAKWTCPLIPAGILTAVNWDNWFSKCGAGLPSGFVCLLVSILITVLCMYKRDEIAEKKVSPMFYIACIIFVWGCSFLLLANIMREMGLMFVFTGLGVIGGGVIDQVNSTTVKSRLDEYKELVETNCLDKKSKAKRERKEQAEKEAIE